jgi:hypothetical protein
MSDFNINNITNKRGSYGPIIAGITTVNSTGAMRIPSGGTGSAYGSGNDDVVKDDSLIFHIDAKYSYNILHPATLYDLSGRNHNISLHGSTLPTYNSSNGGSIVFSESNTNFGATFLESAVLEGGFNGPFTYEAWAYPTNNADYGFVMGTGPDDYTGIGFHGGSSPATYFMYGRNGGGGNQLKYDAGATVNAWNHVVMRCNNTGHGEVQTGTYERAIDKSQGSGNDRRYQSFPGSRVASSIHYADLFENGSYSETQDIGAYVYNDPTSFITLGVYAHHNGSTFSSGEKFTGRIGVTRIYNRALSDAEILQNYNADKTRFGL